MVGYKVAQVRKEISQHGTGSLKAWEVRYSIKEKMPSLA